MYHPRHIVSSLPALLVITTVVTCAVPERQLPPGSFAAQTPPDAPDYSQEEAWAAHPDREDNADQTPPGLTDNQADAPADVFFIHPTTHLQGEMWNADIDDDGINEGTDNAPIRAQASVFNCCARVFAPRYRQAAIRAFIDQTGDGQKALDLAYSDVREAFQYFLTHESPERPLIVAGHSQGSRHAVRLLKEFYPRIRERLVVAYLIGGPVYRDDFAGTGFGPCDRATQRNCFVTYRTLRVGTQMQKRPMDREGVALHCVNPLTWRANQSRRGERKRHHGGVPPDLSGIDPELTDAGCNNGILYISPPAVPAYEIRGGNYHALDYNLFYINLRRNLAERLGVH